MTPALNKNKSGLVGVSLGAYLAGVASGGSGVVPPLIVEGEAPVDSPAWHCEAKGPLLDGKRFCKLDDMEDVGEDTPVVAAPDAGR
jgi:hypothetical protein